MATAGLFLQLAALAISTVAASAVVAELPNPSRPSCDPSVKEKMLARCQGMKPLVGDLNQRCCRDLADRMRNGCFCQDKERMSTALGSVSLDVVCNRPMASCSSTLVTTGCTLPGEDAMQKCRDAVLAMQRQDRHGCFCLLEKVRQGENKSGKPKACLAAALSELGVKNDDVLDRLCQQPSDSSTSPLVGLTIDY